MSRKSLPYRKTTDCFLLYNNKIVARDQGHFIQFPGGGVDSGESPVQAAKREVKEETGGIIDGRLKQIICIKWDWFPKWANNKKRKKRYKKFRGEEIYLFIGKIKKFGKSSDIDKDNWAGGKLMNLNKCITFLEKNAEKEHKNIYAYKMAQLTILKMLIYIKYLLEIF